MTVRTFRKKPVDVEAVKFTGWSSAVEIQTWLPGTLFVPRGYEHHLRTKRECDRSTGNVDETAPSFLVIASADGPARVDEGDWIVKDGETVSFCNTTTFTQMYEAV